MSQQTGFPLRESWRVRGLSPSQHPAQLSSASSQSSIHLQSTIFPPTDSTYLHPNSVNQSHSLYLTPSNSTIHPPRNNSIHVSDASSSQCNSVLHPQGPHNPYNINNFQPVFPPHVSTNASQTRNVPSPDSTISSHHTRRSSPHSHPSPFIHIPHSSSQPQPQPLSHLPHHINPTPSNLILPTILSSRNFALPINNSLPPSNIYNKN